MKKCAHKGCNNKIDEQYRFCYEHRKDKYIGTCYIHGKTTFSEGRCLKCQEMKKPIYRIHKRGNDYYFNRNRKPINKNSFIHPYCKQLTHKTVSYQNRYIGKITNSPGIYGIFVRDKRRKDQMGECLYVGQSINLATRIKQHKKNFVVASNHIKGLKAQSKSSIIVIPKYKVEAKYYMMAKDYWLKDLKFVCLYKFTDNDFKKLQNSEKKILLTLEEQLFIDLYSPKLNTFAARPSY